MPGNTFKPPEKSKSSAPRKRTSVSLTDAQYEEIFTSVINASNITPQNAPRNAMVTSPNVAEQPPIQKAASPKECASVENSQKSDKEKENMKNNRNTDTLSTLYSEDITKNAVYSTPDKIVRPKTFYQALKSLKQKHNNDSFSDVSMNDSLNMSFIMDIQNDQPLSQPPKKLTRRERLLWLQKRRGGGLYVECGKVLCKKWRWLEESDPSEIPEYWTCDMNPNKELASCNIPQKPIPIFRKNDLIQNIYTAGSIVWAKVPGFPWWPAMVDDCPDSEQFYWINNPLFDEPDWYHVVFFDTDEVSRSWMLVKDLKSYKLNPNLDIAVGIHQNYKHRMQIAKSKATHALTLNIKERLETYSFISLWKKDLPDFSDSDSEESDDSEYEQVNNITKTTEKRRKKYNISSDSNDSKTKRYRANNSLNETILSEDVCEEINNLLGKKDATVEEFKRICRKALEKPENNNSVLTPEKKPVPRPKKINKSISSQPQTANLSLNSVRTSESSMDTQNNEHLMQTPQNVSSANPQGTIIKTKKKNNFIPPVKKN